MNDKIYLFTIKDKDGSVHKYATTAMTQFDAEVEFDNEILQDHDSIDYLVKEVELDDVCEDISWF